MKRHSRLAREREREHGTRLASSSQLRERQRPGGLTRREPVDLPARSPHLIRAQALLIVPLPDDIVICTRCAGDCLRWRLGFAWLVAVVRWPCATMREEVICRARTHVDQVRTVWSEEQAAGSGGQEEGDARTLTKF